MLACRALTIGRTSMVITSQVCRSFTSTSMRSLSTGTPLSISRNVIHRSMLIGGGGGGGGVNTIKSVVGSSIGLNTRQMISKRLLSTAAEETTNEIPSSVKWWLAGCTAMVYGIVVVGGITRLTESGLSMVHWKPLTLLPPLNQQAWLDEFEHYKQYPEYKRLNSSMNVEEFKHIFFWEYLHRMWGRAIGVAFTVPLAYYALKGHVRGKLLRKSLGLALGIGFQGVLGWFMVKSGLEEPETNHDVPRVSQYRLAAHFGTAALLYGGMLWATLDLFMPKQRSLPETSALISSDAELATLARGWLKRLRSGARLAGALVFATAISGAFVAGLDAGLIYNTFPKMGGDWVPDGAWDTATFAKVTSSRSPTSDFWPWVRVNLFEDSAAVQFNHRVMAITTASTISLVYAYFLNTLRTSLPPRMRLAIHCMMAMALTQVSLGIATLLYLVPTPLAATHQAGSLALLSTALWVMQEFRRLPPIPK